MSGYSFSVRLHVELMVNNGVNLSQGVSVRESCFSDDAVDIPGAIGQLGRPFVPG
jgi:hypothetical protein